MWEEEKKKHIFTTVIAETDMNFLTGGPRNSWQPITTGNTTTSSYWFNWRVLLCSIWLLISLIFASILISKYEYRRSSKSRDENSEKLQEDCPGLLYEDEVWKPCLKSIHPAWLLLFRVIAFIVLLLMMILNLAVDGPSLMYFYTQ